MKIQIYNLETVVSFGRFRNRTTREIIEIDPTYIIWCIGHLDHSLISDEVTVAITEKYPIFNFSESLKTIMDKKAEPGKLKHIMNITKNLLTGNILVLMHKMLRG